MKKSRIIIEDAFKRFTLDQDKVLPPDDTVRRFREKLAGLDMDILEETVRIDNGRLGIPVYFSSCGKDAAAVTGTRKQMGKGATPQQAEASAVMELAERFSFFSFSKNPENFIIGTYADLQDRALDFDQIARSVHDESEDLAVARKIFERVPMKWTWGFNLTKNTDVLLPFDWFFAINEFNGTSAGNCREEALCQGICEVVERHVSSVISRERLAVPGILPDSATDPMVREMLKKYRQEGIQLYISDFTLDMGIPTVGVLAYDPSTFPRLSEIVWTAGTTPDPQKALSRALTEVAQLAGDFNTGSNYVASGLPKYTDLEEARFVMSPDREIDIRQLPDISDSNIRVELQKCIAALAARDMDVIVIDTTHPLLDIPAFYSIVPGAHFRERAIQTSVAMFAAKILVEKSDPLQAIQELHRFDEMLPGKYYLQFYLGLSYLSAGNPGSAYPCFSRALELNPPEQDIPSIHSYMGVCLKEMGDYAGALAVLKEGAKYDSKRTDLYNLMGFCQYKLGNHEAAIDYFKEVLRIDPTSAIDYANIGSNYRDMGEKAKAMFYYRMALELDPGIDFARDNLEKLQS